MRAFHVLRFDRVAATGWRPQSGRMTAWGPVANEQLQVGVRGRRIVVSVGRVNPFWDWTVPVFVGTIDGDEHDAIVTGTIRPSLVGLVAFAFTIVAAVVALATGRWPLFAFLAFLMGLFVFSLVADRSRVERARRALRCYLDHL